MISRKTAIFDTKILNLVIFFRSSEFFVNLVIFAEERHWSDGISAEYCVTAVYSCGKVIC